MNDASRSLQKAFVAIVVIGYVALLAFLFGWIHGWVGPSLDPNSFPPKIALKIGFFFLLFMGVAALLDWISKLQLKPRGPLWLILGVIGGIAVSQLIMDVVFT